MNWEIDHSTGGKENPDFSEIGRAYGLNSLKVRNIDDLKKITAKDITKENLPLLVECDIDQAEDILPMLMGGQQLNQMYPFNDKILL